MRTKKKKSDRGFTLAEKLGYQGLATLVALSGVWLDPEEATRTPWCLRKRGIRLGRVPQELIRRANAAGGSVTVRVQRAVAEGRRDEARRLIRLARAKGQAELIAALLIGAAILAALLLLPAALQAGQTLLAGLK